MRIYKYLIVSQFIRKENKVENGNLNNEIPKENAFNAIRFILCMVVKPKVIFINICHIKSSFNGVF